MVPFSLSVLGGLSVGATSSPAWTVAGALAWIPRSARVELFASWAPAQVIHGSQGIDGDFSLWTLGGRGCWMPSLGRISVGPCGGFEAGQLTATGTGENVEEASTQHRSWTAFNAGTIAILPLGILSLRGQIEAVIPLARPTFVVDGAAPIHRPWVLSPRFLAGIELHFP